MTAASKGAKVHHGRRFRRDQQWFEKSGFETMVPAVSVSFGETKRRAASEVPLYELGRGSRIVAGDSEMRKGLRQHDILSSGQK
jgi:hypothetical protein